MSCMRRQERPQTQPLVVRYIIFFSKINMFTSLLNDNQSEESLFPNLTLRRRIIGWLTCYALGMCLTFLSFGSLALLVLGRPRRFALLYTAGNLLSLASTTFLVGPQKQWSRMWEQRRIVSSLIFFFCLFFTLVLCISRPERTLLIFLSVVCQGLALLWYSLSFVPFGQATVGRVVSSLV